MREKSRVSNWDDRLFFGKFSRERRLKVTEKYYSNICSDGECLYFFFFFSYHINPAGFATDLTDTRKIFYENHESEVYQSS